MGHTGKRIIIRIKKSDQPIRLVTVFAFLAVLCLPIHTITVAGVGLLMLIGIPLLVLTVPSLIARIKDTRWDKATILLALFFMYNILAFVWTPSFLFSSLYNYVKNVAIVVCLYTLKFNQREKKFLLTGAVLACAMVCMFIITGRNIGYLDSRTVVAVFGVEQDPNYLGYLFLIPMAVTVHQFFNNKAVFTKIVCVVLACLILFCVLMTGSRGALLGVIAVVAICTILRFKSLLGKIAFIAIVIVLALIVFELILSLLPEYLASRFSIKDVIETGGTGRIDIWRNAFEVISEKPYKIIYGFGSGSSHYLLDGWATHNFIIQLLLEGGLISTFLFLYFLWIWAKRLIKTDIMCLSVLMGCMAMAMTLSVNTIYYFWVIFILSIVCSKAASGKTEDDVK